VSRVLLFVQSGDGRPKFEGLLGPLGRVPWQRRPAALKTALGEYGISTGQQHAIEAADRWWLVECANADAGRDVIAVSTLPDEKRWPVNGHILAQGGRP
jgi:hypothetical protein